MIQEIASLLALALVAIEICLAAASARTPLAIRCSAVLGTKTAGSAREF